MKTASNKPTPINVTSKLSKDNKILLQNILFGTEEKKLMFSDKFLCIYLCNL